MVNWIPTAWKIEGGDPFGPKIELAERPSGPPRYAVRNNSMVLSKDGEWEWEPMPSSRTETFLDRCRFDTFEEASQAYEKTILP